MAPGRKKKTYFKNEWLSIKELDCNIWLSVGTNNTSFKCKLCEINTDLALGQSGFGSIEKHAEGETHKKNAYEINYTSKYPLKAHTSYIFQWTTRLMNEAYVSNLCF